MLSLALRVTLVLMSTILIVVLIMLAAFYTQRQAITGGRGFPFPLPQQVAAIVQLAERTPPEERPVLLRALNSAELEIQLLPGPIEAIATGDSDILGVAWMTERYLSALGNRQVVAHLTRAPVGSARWSRLFDNRIQRPERKLQIAVRLIDGNVLTIEARGEALRRLTQRPIAYLALILLLLTGMLSLWGLKRLIRPLEELAESVAHLDVTAGAPALPAAGPPEVRKLVVALNHMRSRIQTLVDGRTRLLAAISHDLGTYLTRLRLRIDWIPDAEQRARGARDVAEMHQLLRDALALGRVEQPAETGTDVCDLREIALHHVQAVREQGGNVGLDASERLPVRGSGAVIGRVFSNLIGNALKYGDDVEVELRRCGSFAEILVLDRGPGIPAGDRALVIEPFYRLDHARNLDEPGSGLGLAIVADIAQRLGGSLYLEDRDGGGLQARVILPIAR